VPVSTSEETTTTSEDTATTEGGPADDAQSDGASVEPNDP
jgi:hypothetical protein